LRRGLPLRNVASAVEAPNFQAASRFRAALGWRWDAISKLKRNDMSIRPLHDRAIVKRLDSKHVTASGIVIPESAAEKPDRGEIVAAGTGKVLNDGTEGKLDVTIGDKVLFGKYSGQAVKIHGAELLVMREEDILAVLEN
jgi:chaperonin GroES